MNTFSNFWYFDPKFSKNDSPKLEKMHGRKNFKILQCAKKSLVKRDTKEIHFTKVERTT